MHIVVLDGYCLNPGDLSWDGFRKLGSLTVYDRTQDSELCIQRLQDAEIALTNKTPLSRATLLACSKLRYIGMLATGYNVVDIQAAKELGIAVTNIPTYGTAAVSQYVIAMLLAICSGVAEHSQAVHAGQWGAQPDWCFWNRPLIELAGKTMGIIGLGKIGQATAGIAGALGMKVLAYDPNPRDTANIQCVCLDTIWAQSDVISLHCPLFPETAGLINRETIQKMKDGVILLNNSRGGLIVEQDLADALNCGKVYAAALDVVSQEPISPDNPLFTAKNCYLTPHISWVPREARQRLMDLAVQNLECFLQGAPQNVVNQ